MLHQPGELTWTEVTLESCLLLWLKRGTHRENNSSSQWTDRGIIVKTFRSEPTHGSWLAAIRCGRSSTGLSYLTPFLRYAIITLVSAAGPHLFPRLNGRESEYSPYNAKACDPTPAQIDDGRPSVPARTQCRPSGNQFPLSRAR